MITCPILLSDSTQVIKKILLRKLSCFLRQGLENNAVSFALQILRLAFVKSQVYWATGNSSLFLWDYDTNKAWALAVREGETSYWTWPGEICANPHDHLTDSWDPCLVDFIINLRNIGRLVCQGYPAQTHTVTFWMPLESGQWGCQA